MAIDVPGQSIPLRSLPNLRDLGGWPTHDGRSVRTGHVYRSVDLHRVDDEDLGTLAGLGVRTVYDLRTQGEIDAEPDRLPPGATGVHLDVLADAAGAAPAELPGILRDPAKAEALLGQGRALTLFDGAYRDIVRLPSALAAYRALFLGIASASSRPVLFHCTTGKDRTGWAAAALLLLLGVPDELVLEEYLLTNAQLLPALQPLLDTFAEQGGDPDLLRPVLGVDASYLRASLEEMTRQFGSIEGYFDQGLGIGTAEQEGLRADLIVSDQKA